MWELREWSRRDIPGITLTRRDLQTARILEQKGRIVIRPIASGVSIEARSYVGLVKLESLELLIRPKFIDDRDFYKMFAYAFNLDKIDLFKEDIMAPVTGGYLTDLLFNCLVREIDKILARCLLKRYREQVDLLTTLRGKVDFSRAMERYARGAVDLPCRYEDLTCDTLENRILLSTLCLITPFVSSSVLLDKVHFLREFFAEFVSLERNLGLLLKQLAYHSDRLNRYYEQAFRICYLIYKSLCFTFEGTYFDVYPAILFDMNNLFERFLGRLLEEFAPPEYEVICQRSLGGYYNREGKQSPLLIPDYQLLQNGKCFILADAKYKLYEDNKVSPTDLYQLTVYSMAGEAEKTIIYYPVTKKQVDYYDLPLPHNKTGIRVYLIGIPLNLLLDKLDNYTLQFDEHFNNQIWSCLSLHECDTMLSR